MARVISDGQRVTFVASWRLNHALLSWHGTPSPGAPGVAVDAQGALPSPSLVLCLTRVTPHAQPAFAPPTCRRMSSPNKKPPPYLVEDNFAPLPTVKFVKQQVRGGPTSLTGSLYTLNFGRHQTLPVDVISAPDMTTMINDKSGATPLGVAVNTRFKAKIESGVRNELSKIVKGDKSDMPMETARVFHDLDDTNGSYYNNGCVPGVETAKGHMAQSDPDTSLVVEDPTVEVINVRFKTEQRGDLYGRNIDFQVKNAAGRFQKASLAKMTKCTFRLIVSVNVWVSEDNSKMSLSIRAVRSFKMRRQHVIVPVLDKLAVGGIEAVEADESLQAAAGEDVPETDSGTEGQISDDGAVGGSENLHGIGHAERVNYVQVNPHSADADVDLVEIQRQTADGDMQLAKGSANHIKQESVEALESPDQGIDPFKAAVAVKAYEIKYGMAPNTASITMVKGSVLGVHGFCNSSEGDQARAEFNKLPGEGFQHVMQVKDLPS